MTRLRVPWTGQPPLGTAIDPYWVKRGLQLVFDGRRVVYSRSASTVQPATFTGGPKAKPSLKGIVTGFGTTSGTGTTDRIDSGILDSPKTGMRSIVAHVFANSTGSSGNALGRVFQNASGSGLANVGDEGVWFAAGGMSVVRSNSLLTGVQYSTTAAFPLGRWAVFGSSFLGDYPTNTAPLLFVDGVSVAVTTNQAATAAFTATTAMNVAFGNRADSTRGFDGQLGPVLIFDGYLTPQEHMLLSKNPWIVFMPLSRNVYADIPSAGGLTLTGQAVVAALGNVAPTIAVPVTGQAAVVALGSALPTVAAPLTGQAIVDGTGTVQPQITVALSGVGTALATGSVTAGISQAATGLGISTAQGSMSPAIDAPLSGSAVALATGSVVVPGDVTVALTGTGTALGLGTLTPVVQGQPGKSHTDLVIRQVLVDYYTKAFEKPVVTQAEAPKQVAVAKIVQKPAVKKQPAAVPVRSPIIEKLMATAVTDRQNLLYSVPVPKDLVTLALKSDTLNLDFSAFAKEQETLKRRREDEDLLLLATIL